MSEQRDGGVLFRNKDKQEGDNRPSMKGFLTLNGNEYEVAAWKKESEKAGVFLSLSVKPKQARQEQQSQQAAPNDDDSFPF